MNRWVLFAWLGLIRFGMEMFEEALKKLWGPKLRQILQQYTNKGRKATLVGTIVTGILNSSTLISLLTLWFVSAGMMQLINAIGILIGANIGSTFTAIIVGYLGFGEFKISMFALPLIAIWGIIMIITSKKSRWYWAKLLVGFWLFFLGIDFLKENIEIMSQLFNFEQYKDMNLWIFWAIGLVVTAMVQSSGAVGVMTLAALHSEIITFDAWFAILLGAAVGTTCTALIASLSGSTAKKQLAVANLIFNALTVVLGIIFFRQFIWITLDVLGYRDNLVMGSAIINAVFSTLTSLLFVPILKPFTKFIQWIIPEKEEVYPLQILQIPLTKQSKKYDDDMATITLNALQTDKIYIIWQVLEYISSIWGIDTYRIKQNEPDAAILKNLIKFDNEEHKELYEKIKDQLDTILPYIHQLSNLDLDKDERQELLSLQQQFINLSGACKSTENVRENIHMLRTAIDKSLSLIYYEMLDHVILLNKAIYAKLGYITIDADESLPQVIQQITQYRDNIITHVAPDIIKGNIWDMDISSLVNMTREITDGYKDLTNSLDDTKQNEWKQKWWKE